MRRILFCSLAAVSTLVGLSTAEARPRYFRTEEEVVVRARHLDRHHPGRTRTLYILEEGRPVRRSVFFDDAGRYYRYSAGQRHYVTERYFKKYPTEYYYDDGRPRLRSPFPFKS